MPTYEYACDACEHQFEEFQGINDEPLKKCPKCKKKKLRRLIGTGAGLIFKGSGFYITDYRSDSYKKAAKADEGSSKPESAKSDAAKSNSETKAESNGSSKSEGRKKAAKSSKSES
jgi:putative FmdB family regulatory protein